MKHHNPIRFAAPVVVAVALLLGAHTVFPRQVTAQTTPDPAIAAAREETVVVYDLGRFFGYVQTMITENPDLELDSTQRRAVLAVMEEIRSATRIEPVWADEMLTHLELDVLTVQQLMEVDRLAIEWQNTRTGGTQTGSGSGSTGSGSGPLSTYVAGGAFNPIVDESRSIGQGFAALYEELR
jgi:hypothetical protein